jgi:hypothetical protein
MTRLEAQRKLREHGQTGNWRFKGLLLAALSGSGVSTNDVAKAWPQTKSDYRFLQKNPSRDPDDERERMFLAEEGSPEAHLLTDFAGDATEEVDDGLYQARADDAIQHMLFAASTPEELDTLFREQLADVVAEGAQRRQQARNGAFIFNADTNTGDVTVADDRQYYYDSSGDGISEGGRIPEDREGYSTVAWDCKKIGVGAIVTEEMVRHARVDLIERQIRHVGETTENDMNRIWLNELVDNANQNFDAAGSNLGVPALNGGISQVDQQDFQPDTFVSHPEFRQELFNDSNLVYVNRSGQDTELREREVDRLFGVDHLPMNNAAYDSGTNTWAYDSDGDLGAVAYQQDHIWLVIEQDIEVRDYEDPVRDLQGVNARAWVDATYAQPDAAATIQY